LSERGARPPAPVSRGGRRAGLRYGRLTAAGSALLVTLVTLLGGIGVLPVGAGAASASDRGAAGTSASLSGTKLPEASSQPATESGTATPRNGELATNSQAAKPAVPAETGEGKRVVFDMSDQRVWLVDGDDDVVSTYLVSGSLTDNLEPGSYAVYSQSRWAVGVDDSGTMQYFTRFAHGANAAIGFHSIPTKNGRALQTRAQLGSPQSHGCIRQWLPDARRLYRFAPVGTKVVVTA
jgi:L,D-transpeptidase catalytic domain